MISDKEIREEINRVTDNPYDNISDVEHSCAFKSESDYVKGLKYALGEDVQRGEFPSEEVIKNIVERIKSEIDDVNLIKVIRKGEPPKYMDVSIYVLVKGTPKNVKNYRRLKKKIRDITREEERDNIVYTLVDIVE